MSLRKLLSVLWLTTWPVFLLSGHEKDRLPPAPEIGADTRKVPVQGETTEPPFSFSYRGRPYDVKPLASYELWGLVVSHNDIGAVSDIYHDRDAVDTKDVCVAWGGAAASEDLGRVSFWNGPFTCYFKYPEGIRFPQQDVSNNHLLTRDPAVRRTVDDLRVGDQIHLKGLLVSYRPAAEPDNWRTSSLTRSDTGPGACEVVFLRELEIRARSRPGWHAVWHASRLALLSLPPALLLFVAAG